MQNIKKTRTSDFQRWLLAIFLLIFMNASYLGEWLQPLDRGLYDIQLSYFPGGVPDDVVIITIDQESLGAIGEWPWDRSYHASLIDLLTQAGASSVAYNVVFASPNPIGIMGDESLSKAISNNKNVILPVYIDRLPRSDQLLEMLPAPMFLDQAILGHVNMHLDEDGVARSVFLREGLGIDYWRHFSQAIADNLYMGQSPPAMKANVSSINSYIRNHQYYFPYVGDVGSFQRHSFIDVLTGQVPLQLFRNKIVFVGVTATSLGDPLSTPLTNSGLQMPAVEVNANIFQAIRSERLIEALGTGFSLGINSIIILLAILLIPRLTGYNQIICTGAVIVAILLLSYLMLRFGQYWYPSINLLVGVGLVPVLWNALRLNRLLRYFKQELAVLRSQIQSEEFIGKSTTGIESFNNDLLSLLELLKFSNYKLTFNETLIGYAGKAGKHDLNKDFLLESHQGKVQLSLCFTRFEESDKKKVDVVTKIFQSENEKRQRVQANASDIFVQQIELIKRYQSQVIEARSLFQSSIHHLGGGVIVGDSFGRVLFKNQEVSRLLKVDEQEGLYIPIFEKMHLAKKEQQWSDLICRALSLPGRVNLEANCQGFDLSVSLEFININESGIKLMLVNISDISEVKAAQRARNEMIDFLSHDMRSPMNSLQAFIQQQRESDSRQELDQLLDTVSTYTNKSLYMTEQLLYLAKAESDENIQMYEVDLYSVAQNAVDVLYHQAKQKDIQLELTIDDDCWVQGNGEMLERVLVNLLGNAIKYTPENTQVTLSVTYNKPLDTMLIGVRDQGCGIPEAQQVDLFKAYQRGNKGNMGAKKGLGLGLRFVDVALKKHGSQIQLKSNEQGSFFYFNMAKIHL